MHSIDSAIQTALGYNPVLATDSYKLSHPPLYPRGVTGMHAYIEPRIKSETIILFGLQRHNLKYMTQRITKEHIDEAEAFAAAHGEPFNRAGWEYIVNKHGGYFPVTIKAIPEGLPVPSGNVLVTVECDHEPVFWLPGHLETALQRAVWYPTTIASQDRATKFAMRHFYLNTGAPLEGLDFALHDFGGRGVTCSEQAEIGGMAHLVNFKGSDTIEGVRAANFYYRDPMAAFSVPATEHSIECSYGSTDEGEDAYIAAVLNQFAKPGVIFSIVIDGYDTFRCAEKLCTKFKDQIIKSGAKVVFRPDSGDAVQVIMRILRLQDATFGHTLNAKGFKKINNVGIIQGDGVDPLAIKTILGNLAAYGYAADNVVFGSGGALLQKVNRDTYKFAQKASAILLDGKWKPISKDPITDPGKKSKEGRLRLVRGRMTHEYMSFQINDNKLNEEYEDLMQTVYDHGEILNLTTLADVRARAALPTVIQE